MVKCAEVDQGWFSRLPTGLVNIVGYPGTCILCIVEVYKGGEVRLSFMGIYGSEQQAEGP